VTILSWLGKPWWLEIEVEVTGAGEMYLRSLVAYIVNECWKGSREPPMPEIWSLRSWHPKKIKTCARPGLTNNP